MKSDQAFGIESRFTIIVIGWMWEIDYDSKGGLYGLDAGVGSNVTEGVSITLLNNSL